MLLPMESGKRVGRSHGILAGLACAALAACGPSQEGDAFAEHAAPVRNAVLVTLDTTRADVLSGDEASRRIAPNIAALADSGLRFPRAYTTAPLTLPAHASLLTGLVPPRHGLRDNSLAALPGEADTLAEVLQRAGFQTAAFVSCVVLDRTFGLDQGFELYDEPDLVEHADESGYVERASAATLAAASAWLEARDESRPFFLWVHFYDPHLPYRSAPEFLAQAGGDAYRGEVAEVDRAVGGLLEALERSDAADETLVVLTADHGESLGEHGEPTHGALCYEAAVRVPLLLRFPGAPPRPGPTRIVSLVDLFPTVLGRLGLPVPDGLDGVDLFSPAAPADRGVYFESQSGFLNYGWSPLAGWLDGRGKYLHSSQPEFYAEPGDPEEDDDLARSHVQECESARAHLAELLARPALPPDDSRQKRSLEAELAVLGYASFGDDVVFPSPLAPSDRPAPRERAHELGPLLHAHALFSSRHFAECVPLVEAIVRENPRNLLARDLLGVALMQTDRFAEAEPVLRERLLQGPERADTHLNLGLCRLELGDPDGALAELGRALELAPEHAEIYSAMERAREAQQKRR